MRLSKSLMRLSLLFLGLSAPAFAFTASDVILPQSTPNSSQSNSSSVPGVLGQSTPSETTLPEQTMPAPPSPAAQQSAPTGSAAPVATVPKARPLNLGDTKVIQLPTSTLTETGFGPKADTTVPVTWADQPAWTTSTENNVSRVLGVAPTDVPNVCTIIFAGRVLTDKGIYPFQLKPGEGSSAAYAGSIMSVSVLVNALCKTGVPPKNAGVVMQVGDRYQVGIDQLVCMSPKGSVSKVVFSYDGKWSDDAMNADTKTVTTRQGRCRYF